MSAKSRPGPRPEHLARYERQPFRYPALEPSDKRERIGYILLGVLLMTVLGPFVPSRRRHRHIPDNWAEYNARLVASAVVAILMGVGAYYQYISKPARNQRRAYRLVGRFVVRGKQQFFGSAWLEFAPDDTHRVGIDPALFDRFQVGDTVDVAYSATGDLISVRKIVLPAATA
jgi:hypothetical protein